MEALSIIFFLLTTYGLGSVVSFFVKESDELLERILMRFGTGLGILLFLGFLLNLLRIPLDWRIFMLLSIFILILKLYYELKRKQLFNLGFNINLYSLLMIVLFIITLYMYTKGAFAYPYLEDDDSWSHALGVKYVAIEKTVFAGPNSPFGYLDPYPPAYDMFFGIIHQTNNSVYWTLKFFNALIVSLSIIFFYFFAKVFTNSSKKAFFSTFALFAVPAFLSHFIWAIALTMPLFFVSFYAIEKIKDDKKWWIVASIVIVPTITSSLTHSTYFGLFFIIYLLARILVEKKFLFYELIAGFSGLLLSFVLWWLPAVSINGLKGVFGFLGPRKGIGVLNIEGTADRVYSLSDFLCHSGTPCYKGQNMINNPIGIGVVLSILTIVGLIFLIIKYREMFEKENYYMFVLMLWFFFALYSVNAAKLPIKLSPFRAWMLLAIPVSLLAGESLNLIINFVKSFIKNFFNLSAMLLNGITIIIFLILAYGIIITSFLPKYYVNTSPYWGVGGFWASNEEIKGYIWFKDNIPPQTRVFTFSNTALIIGLDKFVCHWCKEVKDFRKDGFFEPANSIHSWLKNNAYNYLIIDGQTTRKYGVNETNNKLNDLLNSNLFQPVYGTNAFILLQVR